MLYLIEDKFYDYQSKRVIDEFENTSNTAIPGEKNLKWSLNQKIVLTPGFMSFTFFI